MKKIMTVVGARPQFIKAAPLSAALRNEFKEVLVHTGQHYDNAMSDRFFDELGIPFPDYNLEVGSGSHGSQTARMLSGLEGLMLKERPDGVLIYGDTNSTLAGALAAVKLHIPIFHIEAGLRSFNRVMPEEHNRVLADHMSDLLFCPTQTACDNLEREGIVSGVHMVGDVMADSVRLFSTVGAEQAFSIGCEEILFGDASKFEKAISSSDYFAATIHRAENTDESEQLKKLMNLLQAVESPVVLAAHPRLQNKLQGWTLPSNVFVIKPQGYVTMLRLMQNSCGVITDSGGLQKEAYLLRKKCITLRSETEWVETLSEHWNILLDPAISGQPELMKSLELVPGKWEPYYGDGKASLRIVQIIKAWFDARK